MFCSHCSNKIESELHQQNEQNFCCLGCLTAYNIINKLGFSNYYQQRQINAKERKIKPETEDILNISEFVISENQHNHITLLIQGLHCAACVWLIEGILKQQENVSKARINLSRKTLTLQWQGDKNYGNELIKLISDIGYKLLPFDEKILASEEKKYSDTILKALAVAGFGAGNIMLFSFALWFTNQGNMGIATRNLLHFFSSLIALPIVIYSARPFFTSAYKSTKAGYPNMDLAISIAIFLACVVSTFEAFRSSWHVYFDSAVMLVFFLLIGRYLDLKARKKAFAIASEFSLLAASFGRIEENGAVKIIATKDIKLDMILLVAVGEKIAADGVIIDGESEVDTSIISGETLPQAVKIGSNLYAGTINIAAPIRLRVTKTATSSLLAQISQLVENVELSKNHYIRIADYFSKFYTPAVHLLAAATFALWCFYFKSGWEAALMNATAVLIITCPCALALAIPIVQTILISNLIKQKILVKSGEALEKLPKIDVIIFDKTGSLTIGKPMLIKVLQLIDNQIIQLDLTQPNQDLSLIANLARHSKHPLSQAISNIDNTNSEELKQLQEISGKGLCANHHKQEIKLGNAQFCAINSILTDQIGNNISSCARIGDKEFLFLFADQIKSDAVTVIQQLKALNKKIILLSGDRQLAVESIAKQCVIDEFYFEQTPITKTTIIKKLKEQNQKILMIGDGINDAPSLALADISLSFAQAADISQNIADIIISDQQLQPIITLFKTSQRGIALMKQNLLLALIYNLIAVPFAILGKVYPLIAAIAMSSSSLLVLFNSLRINKPTSSRAS